MFIFPPETSVSQEESQDSPSSVKSDDSPHTHPPSPGIDCDLARMETLLDGWTLDLKRNILVQYTLLLAII